MLLRVVSFNARGLMDVGKCENMMEICRWWMYVYYNKLIGKIILLKCLNNYRMGIFIIIIVQRKLGKELLF